MHYIAILYERTPQSRSTAEANIRLRGYTQPTWVDSEWPRLPVYALAYVFCPTSRDVYLEWVEKKVRPFTWERYQGRVIDELYKLIHLNCQEYALHTPTSRFDLYTHLVSIQGQLVSDAKDRHQNAFEQISPRPNQRQIQAFDDGLQKIVRFEGEITSAFMDFEIARLQSASPNRIFREYFDFNTDFALRAKNQGFATPATPDFVFRHAVVGDIKSGHWQAFFEYTVVAYALAYEEHTHRDMNYGAILHVELPRRRQVPAHYEGDVIYLDDAKRRRFLAVRNRKLQIVANAIDPGKPDSNPGCAGCSFYSDCWSDANG